VALMYLEDAKKIEVFRVLSFHSFMTSIPIASISLIHHHTRISSSKPGIAIFTRSSERNCPRMKLTSSET
jgi:hypothetical protein